MLPDASTLLDTVTMAGGIVVLDGVQRLTVLRFLTSRQVTVVGRQVKRLLELVGSWGTFERLAALNVTLPQLVGEMRRISMAATYVSAAMVAPIDLGSETGGPTTLSCNSGQDFRFEMPTGSYFAFGGDSLAGLRTITGCGTVALVGVSGDMKFLRDGTGLIQNMPAGSTVIVQRAKVVGVNVSVDSQVTTVTVSSCSDAMVTYVEYHQMRGNLTGTATISSNGNAGTALTVRVAASALVTALTVSASTLSSVHVIGTASSAPGMPKKCSPASSATTSSSRSASRWCSSPAFP